MQALPRSLQLRMTTTTTEGYSGAASGQKNLILNSIYDPLGSHTSTNQPVGYDEWGAFFSKYMVVSGMAEINFSSKSATTITERVVVWTSSVAGGAGTWDDAACLPTARLYTMGAGKNSIIIRVPFKVSSILGERLDESTEAAAWGADPTNKVYCNIWVTSTGGNYDCTTDIRLIQNVIVFSSKQINMGDQ